MNKMAHVAGYGLVWFNDTLNVNIICLHNIKKIYHMEYNSKTENAFILQNKHNNTIVAKFIESPEGLYI